MKNPFRRRSQTPEPQPAPEVVALPADEAAPEETTEVLLTSAPTTRADDYPPDEFTPDAEPAAPAAEPVRGVPEVAEDAGTPEVGAAKAVPVAAAAADAGGREQRPSLFRWIVGAFTDPQRRPRSIVWLGATILLLAAVVIVALGATSTYWFCANGCHKVQDDTISAYQASTHNKISCMACHMPVGASPLVFILHKAEALGELYMTVTNNYELPLNGSDTVSLEMASTQCTQCHTINRSITPDQGIRIDHAVHAKKDIQCPECHNRVAHNDDVAKPMLVDPVSGKTNQSHPNFMTMNACFRCHSQAKSALAPGKCSACHTPGFKLKPESHLAPGFFPKGHGELGKAEAERTRKAKAEVASETVAGTSEAELRTTSEKGVPEGVELPPVDTINTCYTCHDAITFCNKCHGGVEMPHPVGFKQKHSKIAKAHPKACERCHGKGTAACDSCHHGTQLGWEYNPNVAWRLQHPAAVQQTGATACFACHNPTYCAHCHVNTNPQ